MKSIEVLSWYTNVRFSKLFSPELPIFDRVNDRVNEKADQFGSVVYPLCRPNLRGTLRIYQNHSYIHVFSQKLQA